MCSVKIYLLHFTRHLTYVLHWYGKNAFALSLTVNVYYVFEIFLFRGYNKMTINTYLVTFQLQELMRQPTTNRLIIEKIKCPCLLAILNAIE